MKNAFEHAHVQSIIWVFATPLNILCLLIMLFADREDPDQTVRMHRLIWAFVVRLCPNTRFCMGGAYDLDVCTKKYMYMEFIWLFWSITEK